MFFRLFANESGRRVFFSIGVKMVWNYKKVTTESAEGLNFFPVHF